MKEVNIKEVIATAKAEEREAQVVKEQLNAQIALAGAKDETIVHLRENIQKLRAELEDLKESKTIYKIKYRSCEDYYDEPDSMITYEGNMDELRRELLEKIEKDLKDEVKSLKDQIENQQESHNYIVKGLNKANTQISERKDEEIAKLKKDLKALKDDKTEEKLLEERKEEIKALHDRISELESELETVNKLSWIGRKLYDKAKRKAMREVAKTESNTMKRMGEYLGSWKTTLNGWTNFDSYPF